MRRLVIETATSACSIALIEDGHVLSSAHDVVGRGHAEHLIGMIASFPRRGRADAILVGCGPGSFTGVRVGIAAARGLGLGWQVPVAGFSTLALIAAMAFAAHDADEISVAIEGGHGELFVQNFSRGPDLPAGELQSLPLDQAILKTSAHIVAGNASSKLVSERGHGLAVSIEPRAAEAFWLPESATSHAPTPIYGRAPDAKPMTQ